MTEKAAQPQLASTPTVRIALTDAQRARIKQQTGRDLEVIEVADPNGHITLNMDTTSLDDVEMMAFRQAELLNDEDRLDQDMQAREAEAAQAEQAGHEKAASIEADIQARIDAMQEAIAEAFAIEGMAAEAAREEARAAHQAANKKRR